MFIEPGTDKFDKLFGSLGKEFRSTLPPHSVLMDALADPSIDPSNIDTNFAITNEIGSTGALHSQGVTDFQDGARWLLRSIAVPKVGVTGAASNGVMSNLLPAIKDVTFPAEIASSLNPKGVGLALGDALMSGTTGGGSAGATVAKAAFGIGMAALSAAGPVGAAAAAIVGFAAAIFGAFRSKKIKEAKDAEERRAAAYERLPPLQEPKIRVDDWYVNSVVRGVLETGHWTRLFSPRFDPRAEWVGSPRFGGYGFATGKVAPASADDLGVPKGLFTPVDGVGFIPGMNEITSVIQVSLNPFGAVVDHWRNQSAAWPIKQAIVRDVGSFYVNTGRLCSIAWSWATQQHASPDLYKINVGTAQSDDTECLHYRWRSYCDGGLDFLRKNATESYEIEIPGTGVKATFLRVKDPMHPEYLFGSAIGCAIGSWRCRLDGGTTYHPVYSKLTSGSYVRFDMDKPGLGPGRSRDLGCVIDPASYDAKADGSRCIVTMYETSIKQTLNAVRRRQLSMLRRSLVCAYVRRGWDAFKDKPVRDRLDEVRQILLEHPDRKLVRLSDVPDNEPFVGTDGKTRDWKQALIDAGVPRIPMITTIKGRSPGVLDPKADEPPTVPGTNHAMPFADLAIEPGDPQPRSTTWAWATGVGVALALGGAAIAYPWERHRQREQRSGR